MPTQQDSGVRPEGQKAHENSKKKVYQDEPSSGMEWVNPESLLNRLHPLRIGSNPTDLRTPLLPRPLVPCLLVHCLYGM